MSALNSFLSITSPVLFESSQTTLKSVIPRLPCTSLKNGSTRFLNWALVNSSLNSKSWNLAAVDTALAGYESIENKSYGIGFAVNEDLSISYTVEESQPNAMTAATAAYEMEITSIQASYTMGGMSLSVSRDEVDNADYVNATEQNETLIAVSMAF